MFTSSKRLKAFLFGGVGALTLMSGTAYAGGTTAGVEVLNSFVLNYSVGDVDQPKIDTTATGTNDPTKFTVDRLVDLTVAAVGTALLRRALKISSLSLH